MKTLFIVVPAYNEKGNIEKVIHEIKSLSLIGLNIEFVVINDGSTDGTAAIAKNLEARVVTLPYNMGIGLSVQTGFKYALSHGADFVVQVDGDGQHIPQEISKLLPLIFENKADVVIGTRFHESNRQEGLKASTPLRWIAGRVLAWTVNFLSGTHLTDTTSGFRIYTKRAAHFIANEYPDDYPEVEVLVMLTRYGFKLAEVPVQMRPRIHGVSSINWSRSVYYIVKVLLASFMDKIRHRKIKSVSDA